MFEPITSEIFQVGGPSLTSPNDAALYLIRIGDHGALVDAGCEHNPDRLLENIASCGLLTEQIEYLLITHCHIDHVGGAMAIRELTGCRTVAHERDAVFLETGDNAVTAADWYGKRVTPCPVDCKLRGDQAEIILAGRRIEAIHTPGHSPGSLVYLVESDGNRVLFAQDVHGPLHPILRSDQNDYIASLKRIIAMDADILCEGHFGIYRGKEKVRRFLESFMSIPQV